MTHQILGKTVTMPVRVRDASAANLMYDVEIAAAQRLAPAGFEVVESAPGRAQFALTLIDYRDNDLGSYHEIGTILFVRPEGGGLRAPSSPTCRSMRSSPVSPGTTSGVFPKPWSASRSPWARNRRGGNW